MKRALLLVVALVLGTPGCVDFFWADPDTVEVQRTDGRGSVDALQEEVTEHPGDLAKRFELAQAQEANGLLEAASLNYGIVAQELPERLYTRPWLSFGRVELALGRDLSARKAFELVLSIKPDDSSAYVLNSDYREAAVRLAPLLSKGEDLVALEKLQQRYLDELGGDPEEWPAR